MYLWIVALFVCYVTLKWLLRKLRVGSYEDKFVLITGSDSGFGHLLAKELDRMKLNVIAACLTEKGETELKKTCSGKLKTISLDVTKETSIANALVEVNKILSNGKGLWAVVNNAGIAGSIFPVEWLTKEEYERTLAINLYGVIYVTQTFLPLIRREKGRIVNMSSITARFACVSAPYVISKFGVEAFSDTLRHELYNTGVTTHIIEPGFFATSLVRHFSQETVSRIVHERYASLTPEIRECYKEYKERLIQVGSNMSEKASPDIYKVVDAYIHAVTAKYPQARYIVGNDAKYLFRILWNLPEWLSDFMWFHISNRVYSDGKKF